MTAGPAKQGTNGGRVLSQHGPGDGGGGLHVPMVESQTLPGAPAETVPTQMLLDAQPQIAEVASAQQMRVVVVVDVVVVVAQLDVVHASQQLANCPAHAVPPVGATQAPAVLLIAHFVTPVALVRQHVTKGNLPHVDLDAHFLTNTAQLLFVRTAFAC